MQQNSVEPLVTSSAQTHLNLMADINCSTINANQYESLLANITNDLIFKTLKSLKCNKTPGPDGFTLEFYLATWDIVGTSLCAAIKHFFCLM